MERDLGPSHLPRGPRPAGTLRAPQASRSTRSPRPADPSIWVEFLGLPGAGKSDVSSAVAGLLRARGCAVAEPSYELDHSTPTPERRAAKLWLAALGWAHGRPHSRFWLDTIVRSRQDSARRLRAVTFNWFYMLGSAHRAAGIPGVHIFDQGLLQALWSIGYAAALPDVISPRLLTPLRHALPARPVLVLVEADGAAIRRRLATRTQGHSRLERDLVSDHALIGLATATAVLERVEGLARELARVHDATLLRLDTSAGGSVSAGSAAIADAIADRLADRRGGRATSAARALPDTGPARPAQGLRT